jgi:hypothetical protein
MTDHEDKDDKCFVNPQDSEGSWHTTGSVQ